MATLTPEQSARLLEAVRHSHVYWPVLISLATGARRGETLALRWRNVDLDRGTVRIVESLEQTKAGLRFKSPKTDRTRAVTLPGFAVEELRRRKREQAEDLLALGVRQTENTLVCARRAAEPLQPQSLTHEFPRFLSRLRDFPRSFSRPSPQPRDAAFARRGAPQGSARAARAFDDQHDARPL
jgi:integrase